MRFQRFVLLLFVLFIGAAFAQPPHRGGYGNRGKGDGSRMAQELGLSQEQQEQLKEIRQKHRAEKPDNRSEVKALRRQIAEELKKSSPSKSKIKTLADKIGALHSANAVRMAEHMLEVKAVLTPEQFSKMLELKEQRKAHKQGARKGHKGGGKGYKRHKNGGACCPQS